MNFLLIWPVFFSVVNWWAGFFWCEINCVVLPEYWKQWKLFKQSKLCPQNCWGKSQEPNYCTPSVGCWYYCNWHGDGGIL